MLKKYFGLGIPLAVVGLAFYTTSGNYWDAYWWGKWAVLLSLAACATSFYLAKRIHWSVAPIFLSTVLGCLRLVAFRDHPYVELSLSDIYQLQRASAYTGVTFLILTLFITQIRGKEIWVRLEDALAWLCILDASYILWQWMQGLSAYSRGGLFGNASIGACFIAFTYPLLVFRNKPLLNPGWVLWTLVWELFCMLAPVIAVFATQSSMGVGALLVAIYAGLFMRLTKIPMLYRIAVPTVLAWLFLGLSDSFQGLELWNDNGRWKMWEMGLSYGWDHYNIWLGTGPGTTVVLLPFIQNQTGHMAGEWWIFFHNDFVQTFFEQGIFGLASLCLLYWVAVYRARHSKYLLPAVLSYGFVMLGNYPWRMPLHALAGMVILIQCLHASKLVVREAHH